MNISVFLEFVQRFLEYTIQSCLNLTHKMNSRSLPQTLILLNFNNWLFYIILIWSIFICPIYLFLMIIELIFHCNLKHYWLYIPLIVCFFPVICVIHSCLCNLPLEIKTFLQKVPFPPSFSWVIPRSMDKYLVISFHQKVLLYFLYINNSVGIHKTKFIKLYSGLQMDYAFIFD